MSQPAMSIAPASAAAAERLRHLEHKLQAGLWIRDLESGRLEWSPGVYALYGLDPETVPPSRAFLETLVHPDDLGVFAEYDLAVAEGRNFEGVHRLIQPRGRVLWVRIQSEVLFGREGRPVRVIGVMQEIAREQSVDSKLASLKSRYDALVRAIGSLVWTARPDGFVREYQNFVEARSDNDRAAKFLGFGWKSIVHADDLAATERAWEEAIAAKKTLETEHRILHADGSYRWTRSRAAPIVNKDGSLAGWKGVSVDIHAERDWSVWSGDRPITGAQIRAARGILNWSVKNLADEALVTAAAVRRLEEREDEKPKAALNRIRSALENAGIEFLFPAVGKPGVRPA